MIRIDHETSVKEFFEAVDNYLSATESSNRTYIWNILSAMRGPDESHKLTKKLSTTGNIRGKVLPKFMAKLDGMLDYIPEADINDVIKKYDNLTYNHFDEHIMLAALAIQASWGE